MKKEKNNSYMFIVVSVLAFVVTLILSLMNTAFIPSCMLMLSLLLFSICFIIKDNKNKIMLYILYVVGVLLIISSLIYTFVRIY